MGDFPSNCSSSEKADAPSFISLRSKTAGNKPHHEIERTKSAKIDIEERNDTILMMQKPKEYKWLSKSSKRRVRSGVQKQKRKRELEDCGFKRTVIIRFNFKYEQLLDNGGLEALAQCRLGILEGADPFSNCRGVWHRFSCGHQFRVLCTFCAEAWDSGEYPFCALKVLAQLPGDLGKNLYWPMRCSECEGMPQYNPSWKLEDEPVGESYETVRFTPFKPEYLDEEGLRSTSSCSFYRIPKWNRWRLPKPNEEFGKQHSCKETDTD